MAKFHVTSSIGHGCAGFYCGNNIDEAYEAYVQTVVGDSAEFGLPPGFNSSEDFVQAVRDGRGVCNLIVDEETFMKDSESFAEYQSEKG